MTRRFTTLAALAAAAAACAFDPSGRAADEGGGGIDGEEPDPMDEPGDEVMAPASCAEALAGGVETSGVIEIDPGGAGRFPVYCDMETDGGGWTLALKADGSRPTFRYSSPLWTTVELHNPEAADRDRTEAKLESFNRLRFAEVLIRFETEVDDAIEAHWVWMDLAGDSLLALFAAGEYVPVYLGREKWLDAIPASSLQDNCNLEGVNAGVDYNRVRLGIVGNDEEDCATPDSKLGIGNSYACADCRECDDGPGLAGPAAGSNDRGCWTVVSFASLMVR